MRQFKEIDIFDDSFLRVNNKRPVELLIWHCSATTVTMDVTPEDIYLWHTDPKPLGNGEFKWFGKILKLSELPKEIRENQYRRGNGWSDIGYHYILDPSGKIWQGRTESRVGSHTQGYNSRSLGACWIGGSKRTDVGLVEEDNRTQEQLVKMRNFDIRMIQKYPHIKLAGHRQFTDKKYCPSFDPVDWFTLNQIPFNNIYR